MQGYNLAERRYENSTLSEDEMWLELGDLFSLHPKNFSSYKFRFLKSIEEMVDVLEFLAVCEASRYSVVI